MLTPPFERVAKLTALQVLFFLLSDFSYYYYNNKISRFALKRVKNKLAN